MSRISELWKATGWQQAALGARLGVTQERVSQLVRGARESRSVAMLADQVAIELERPDLTADGWAGRDVAAADSQVSAAE